MENKLAKLAQGQHIHQYYETAHVSTNSKVGGDGKVRLSE